MKKPDTFCFTFTFLIALSEALLSGEQLERYLKRVMEDGKVAEVLKEKQESVVIWNKIDSLAAQIEWSHANNKNYLQVSSTYGRIKYDVIQNVWTVMLLGMTGDSSGEYDKEKIKQAIQRYDELWEEWKKLVAENPNSGTIYYPHAFAIDYEGVYPDKKKGVEVYINKYRNI